MRNVRIGSDRRFGISFPVGIGAVLTGFQRERFQCPLETKRKNCRFALRVGGRGYRGTSRTRKCPPPWNPAVGLCLWFYGGPRGVGVFS